MKSLITIAEDNISLKLTVTFKFMV